MQDFFILARVIYVCNRCCRASRRRKQDPPLLSSDEEDDAEFLRDVQNRDARRGGRHPRGLVALDSSDEMPDFDPRNILLHQIRDIITQNARRRHILGQLGDIERRLLEATEKSRKLSLKRYVQSLEQTSHESYLHKDPDMPDCTICLITFAPED